MSYPINSPLMPWNMAQQLRLIPGCNFLIGMPITDSQGVAYAKSDVAEIWFGMIDSAGNPVLQANTFNGVTIDDSVPNTPPMAVVDIIYSSTRNIPPGGYPFAIAMQIEQRVMPMAGGVVNVSRSPIVWV